MCGNARSVFLFVSSTLRDVESCRLGGVALEKKDFTVKQYDQISLKCEKTLRAGKAKNFDNHFQKIHTTVYIHGDHR